MLTDHRPERGRRPDRAVAGPAAPRFDGIRLLLLLGALCLLALGGVVAAHGAVWWALAVLLIALCQLVFGLW